MHNMQDNIVDAGIANAPHWLNHSYVVLTGVFTAGDLAAVVNAMASVKNAAVEMRAGDQAILKVRRMVKDGRVAVMLRNGKRYEKILPAQAGELLPDDLQYISDQIDLVGKPLSAEEQEDFLASAGERSEASWAPENSFPKNSFSPNSTSSSVVM